VKEFVCVDPETRAVIQEFHTSAEAFDFAEKCTIKLVIYEKIGQHKDL